MKQSGQFEKKKKDKEENPLLKYIKNQVVNVFLAPMSLLIEGAVILKEDHFFGKNKNMIRLLLWVA